MRPYLICVLSLLTVGRVVADEKQVAVFLLIGQSNMVGHGRVSIEAERNGGRGQSAAAWRSSVRILRMPDCVMRWVSGVSGTTFGCIDLERHGRLKAGFGVQPDRMGPELGFGVVAGDHFAQPVLLVKLAWGGKSLARIFVRRPRAALWGRDYAEVLQRAKRVLADPGPTFQSCVAGGLELRGIGWHQGWNDRVNQAFNDEYERNMAHFIRDIRRDLQAPVLPFGDCRDGDER
ncbi:MAG UNVERIFIED_CONTAM: sialate O-acetylesterase [Planctomycetaceae bacterium]|jgi:alpha-galactosidase